MSIWNKPRKRQWIGFYIGSYFTVVLVLIGSSGFFPSFIQKGPMNTGHEKLKCHDCHQEAPGSLRQQVQASVKYVLNRRQDKPFIGHLPVESQACLDCHDRPNDRHAVFRFMEPRFADVRKKMQPQSCLSCHLEHNGRRVTTTSDYCIHCHEKLVLKTDPLDISHQELIEDKNWASCLRCHDFHGNHIYKTPTRTTEMIPNLEILKYFEGAPSPYSSEKRYEAKKTKDK